MVYFYFLNAHVTTISPLVIAIRISGDTARRENIAETVGANMKKSFAKAKWKVGD